MIHFFWTHVQSLTATKAWRHWIHITSESQLWSMPFDIIPPMAKLISLKKGQITQLMQREGAKAISVDEIWSLGFQWLWSVSCLNLDPGVLATVDKDRASFAARNSFASRAINIWQCVAIKKLPSMLSKQSHLVQQWLKQTDSSTQTNADFIVGIEEDQKELKYFHCG